jgi:hypothetical protein
MPPQKEPPAWLKARIVVWFDEPSACLCIGNRSGLENGETLPPEKIIKIPWNHADTFVEAVMNSAMGESFREDAEDYDRIMYGVQKTLDQRALRAFDAAEQLRIARSKAAGGGVIDSRNDLLTVHADRHGKLLELLGQVKVVFTQGGDVERTKGKVKELMMWLDNSGLLEDR